MELLGQMVRLFHLSRHCLFSTAPSYLAASNAQGSNFSTSTPLFVPLEFGRRDSAHLPTLSSIWERSLSWSPFLTLREPPFQLSLPYYFPRLHPLTASSLSQPETTWCVFTRIIYVQLLNQSRSSLLWVFPKLDIK